MIISNGDYIIANNKHFAYGKRIANNQFKILSIHYCTCDKTIKFRCQSVTDENFKIYFIESEIDSFEYAKSLKQSLKRFQNENFP